VTASLVAQAVDVWKRFGRHTALRGLNLKVPEGSAYALLGPNGAGKTTITRLLLNMLAPTQGSATVLGVDTRGLHSGVLAQIGYVSESQVLPARLTAREYLDYLRSFYPTWDTDLEASICARLDVPLTRRIGQLSHGQRVKAAVACALPFRPRLLILDEPFSGLDPLVREELMAGVLQQAGELTLLISSHELVEIEHVATHIGFMDEGRMLVEEPMGALAARLRAMRITLDRPATAPERVPQEWLQLEVLGNVVSFIDTRYSREGLAERISSVLGPVKAIDAQPMQLRAVFNALARAARAGKVP
jgi:ABC-2 type transport system ATP-binding protein